MGTNIHKRSIVWYYDSKLKDWKRGKVICVNRYYVTVKGSQDSKIRHFVYNIPVVTAYGEKPMGTPAEVLDKQRMQNRYQWMRGKNAELEKYRLLVRLGLKT